MGKERGKRRLRHALETLLVSAVFVVAALYAAGAALSRTAAEEASQSGAEETAAAAWTVVIDAGHGGRDGGAVGTVTGIAEAPLNLAVAKLVQADLEAEGVQVRMTRSDDAALGKDKAADMRARRAVMNAPGVKAVVSIHMNRFGDPTVKGPMAFYMEGAEEGQALAEAVIGALTDAVGAPERSANPGDYYIVRESAAPAVIVECGFLSNAAEEALLATEEYQRLLAAGIAEGVLRYLRGEAQA